MTIEEIPNGSVTTPGGFLAGAIAAKIKNKPAGALDLAILYSKSPCTTAGVFTANKVKAAPVLVSRQHLQHSRASAVVVNAGCANACTSSRGLTDARQMAEATAEKLGLKPEEVLVASTGVIGVFLPMDNVLSGVNGIKLSADSGHEFARAIMTTDTHPKEIAVSVSQGNYYIAGAVKGAGMIHPDLATLLCFLTTDAAVEVTFLKSALKRAVDTSLNMLSIDGDTSTNDSVFLLANGVSKCPQIRKGSAAANEFQQALNYVCKHLTRQLALDGEGATRLIEAVVKGAKTEKDARSVAKKIISSSLVKAAVHGCDPNWGRIICAVGNADAEVTESLVDIKIGGISVAQNGVPVTFDRDNLKNILGKKEVLIDVDLKLGNGTATAWGCDLSEEYVTINSAYTT